LAWVGRELPGASPDGLEQIQLVLGLGVDLFSTGHLRIVLRLGDAFIESPSEQELGEDAVQPSGRPSGP
jgi:hypothetical protein